MPCFLGWLPRYPSRCSPVSPAAPMFRGSEGTRAQSRRNAKLVFNVVLTRLQYRVAAHRLRSVRFVAQARNV